MSEQLQIISVCENEVKEIRCTSGEKIRVMFANFGRLNNHTCPHDMYDYQSKTDCRAQTSLGRVQDKCQDRAVFTWLSKGIGFGFGFGFTTPFGWLVYLLWFWFYDSQVKTALTPTVNWNQEQHSSMWIPALEFLNICWWNTSVTDSKTN